MKIPLPAGEGKVSLFPTGGLIFKETRCLVDNSYKCVFLTPRRYMFMP